ncbi:hypothetical protein D910_01942 [Dendroctonus ponderosae]|uniref:DUF5641 domain-containing protein n=1 Tax=Dendroctonus ponderosae TaxID=77166 RepID=U4TUR1_DENPD|nr:hypothetical protein D910_01942 [Dendroctonus ponderosae]
MKDPVSDFDIPEKQSYSNIAINQEQNKLQRIEVSVQHVWNRWKNEFLSELQNRVKWKRISQCNFKVGTLVLVKHDSGPILDWKLGRILKYPGKDNVCRVVDIKTRQGTIRRSVNQICALPVD